MEYQDIETALNKWGIGLTIVLVISVIVTGLIGKFVVKKVEQIVSDNSERSMKTFQATIDKDLYKFQTKHERQVNAIHETYQKFQQLGTTINFLMKGDQFLEPPSGKQMVSEMVTSRIAFIDAYRTNKLLFSSELCLQIDALLPVVDQFIIAFNNGLFPEPLMTSEENENNEPQLVLGGIWAHGELEAIIEIFDQIANEIERDFRKIYGTAD
ncbi:hypothetical protein QG516_03485 [Pedobacter gandavensis]|uniref:hypothetical protein n=1 Tax=Pedobacter gandavensis TaxID=2679963 RepID=UPI0024794B3D|nr:hypothetical protein [Pedobacter gandavensis]WGQ10717.1 hypothetical protein QG516_03485 [Pedobacter gandavensis]